MRSSNPVLAKLGDVARQERSSDATIYEQHPFQTGQGHAPPTGRTMTVDDVVVRAVALLALTGITGAASWLLLPDGPTMVLAMIGSVIATLVLGLVISFARITNPLVIGLYAVLQGVLMGVVSRWFEQRYPGIVMQAVIGTFGIFAIMVTLYKVRAIRATPRFTRIVIGALIGVVVLSLLNFVAYLFGLNLGLRDYSTEGEVGWLPIAFSVVVIIVGALTLILDFDMIEQGVQVGLPEKFAWYCAFGLLVGLIFLYWEILRLLSYFRR